MYQFKIKSNYWELVKFGGGARLVFVSGPPSLLPDSLLPDGPRSEIPTGSVIDVPRQEDERMVIPIIEESPEVLIGRLRFALADFELRDEQEDNVRRMRGFFDHVRFLKTRCFYSRGGEYGGEERLGNLVYPELAPFVRVLNDFLWIERFYPRYEYIFDAYRLADELSDSLKQEEYSEGRHLKAVHGVRQTFSSLLSSSLMERVNRRVGYHKERCFLYGQVLHTDIEAEVARMNQDSVLDLARDSMGEELAIKGLDVTSVRIINGLMQEIREEIREEISGIVIGVGEEGGENYLSELVKQKLVEFLYRDAELMGGLRPTLNDFGTRIIADGIRQIMRGGIGSDKMIAEKLVLLMGEANDRMSRMLNPAQRDALTGLYNRFKWDEEVKRRKESPRKNEPYTIIAIDFAGFKRFNDNTFYLKHVTGEDGEVVQKRVQGHPLGDDVMVNLAEAMQGVLKRDDDLLCRCGGEEFFILIPKDLSQVEILAVLKMMDDALLEVSQRMEIRYREEFEREFAGNDPESTTNGFVRLGFSAGVAKFARGVEIEDVIANADGLMFHNKHRIVDGDSQPLPYNDRIGVVFGQGFSEEEQGARYNLFRRDFEIL